ncbi:MAG TPA: class I SAM-dependent methyltransferase [Myxococcota bacterium]|nr:class I SAM-dependent methyltransferase [Myxococcota bacterium]
MAAERCDEGRETTTETAAYAARLERAARSRWRRWLDVQAPYRWNLRRLALGRTLEVGCGVGRNLRHLGKGAVGIDRNALAVDFARRAGLDAFQPEEFRASPHAQPPRFDTLLFAHVLEHMSRAVAVGLVREHLAYLAPGGRVVVITPQERGFASDETHVEFMDFVQIDRILRESGLEPLRFFSFPLPRLFGRIFPYNEFVGIGRLP